MSDPLQKPRFIEGKDVIYVCRGAGWARWAMELLDLAHKSGCRLRKTGTHHVMITNDLGMTTTLAGRNSSNGARSRKDTMKVIDAQREHVEAQAAMLDSPVVTGESKAEPPLAFKGDPELDVDLFAEDDPIKKALATTGVEPETLTGNVPLAKGVLCNFHKPPRWFEVQEDLDRHREAEHRQCKRLVVVDGKTVECGEWLPSGKSLGGHVGVKHGKLQEDGTVVFNRPWEHKQNYKGGDGKANGTTAKAPARKAKSRKPKSGTVDELISNVRRGKTPRPTVPITLPNTIQSNGTKPDPRDLAVQTLMRIRAELGDDPRIAELELERDAWKRRAEDAETKNAMMLAAADQMRAAAEL